MPRPRVYKTEAIVLRHDPLGDADKILTVYTPYLGKLRAVAKGVRKPRSKLAGHVEPLTRSAMLIARGQNLDVLTQSQTIDSFVSLREDLVLTSQAIYAAELLDLFTVQEDANPDLYQTILSVLKTLSLTQDGGLALRHYELRLLGNIGFKPELYSCVSCHSPVAGSQVHFSASGGGVLCSGCLRGEVSVRPISPRALKALRYFQQASPSKITEITLPMTLSKEIEATMRAYIRYLLEREVKSTAFLDTLFRQPLGPVGVRVTSTDKKVNRPES